MYEILSHITLRHKIKKINSDFIFVLHFTVSNSAHDSNPRISVNHALAVD